MPSGLSRCKCYASDEAIHILNNVGILVFRTNTLNLEFPQVTAMVFGVQKPAQGSARTSPQGAPGIDGLWHNKTKMRDERRLRFR